MTMKTVYRIEDGLGTGIYNLTYTLAHRDMLDEYEAKHLAGNEGFTALTEAADELFRGMDHYDDNHLIPTLDFGYDEAQEMYRQGFVCGFESVEQMRAWFPDDYLNFFLTVGVLINVYTVPAEKVAVGRVQVMFDPEVSTKVAQITEID